MPAVVQAVLIEPSSWRRRHSPTDRGAVVTGGAPSWHALGSAWRPERRLCAAARPMSLYIVHLLI